MLLSIIVQPPGMKFSVVPGKLQEKLTAKVMAEVVTSARMKKGKLKKS